MNKSILTALVCTMCLVCSAMAQQASGDKDIVARINASGNIEVNQPAELGARLCTEPAPQTDASDAVDHKAPHGKVGYRIQVFDDNNPRTARGEAQNRKHLVESRFPYLRAYVQFNSPYWRVKVGDFRSRSEAEAVLEEMDASFPGLRAQMRVVRDHINVAD